MIANYLKVAIGSVERNRGIAAINVACLALGMPASLQAIFIGILSVFSNRAACGIGVDPMVLAGVQFPVGKKPRVPIHRRIVGHRRHDRNGRHRRLRFRHDSRRLHGKRPADSGVERIPKTRLQSLPLAEKPGGGSIRALHRLHDYPTLHRQASALHENQRPRIPITPAFFIISGFAALVIALFTVSYQTYAAARKNPAHTLRRN